MIKTALTVVAALLYGQASAAPQLVSGIHLDAFVSEFNRHAKFDQDSQGRER